MQNNEISHQQDPLDLVNDYEYEIREWAKEKQQSSQVAIDMLEQCLTESTMLANRFYGVKALEGVYPAIPPSTDFKDILEKAIDLKNQNIRMRMLSWVEVYTPTQLEQLKAAAELVDMIIDDCRSKRKVKPFDRLTLKEKIETRDLTELFGNSKKELKKVIEALVVKDIWNQDKGYLIKTASRKHYQVHALAKAITHIFSKQFNSLDAPELARSLFVFMETDFHKLSFQTQNSNSFKTMVDEFESILF